MTESTPHILMTPEVLAEVARTTREARFGSTAIQASAQETQAERTARAGMATHCIDQNGVLIERPRISQEVPITI